MWSRALACLATLAACYGPTVPEGAPCSTTTQCPSPQLCSNNHCSLTETPLDTAIDQALVDAAIDARPIDAPVDAMIDAPILPAACTNTVACPNNGTKTWFVCAEDCYIACSAPASRDLSETACAMGANRLARITGESFQNCMKANLTTAVWIGARQDAGQVLTEAGWKWGNGVALSYTHWGETEPNDNDGIETGQENCAVFSFPSGDWFDTSCGTGTYRPLCEVDN